MDAWADDRRYLLKDFLPIDPYNKVTENDRCFLCGRRGSGKSAIAVKIIKSDFYSHRKVIEGEESQYGAYMDQIDGLNARRLEGLKVDIKRFIKLLWVYTLQIVMLQETINYLDKIGKNQKYSNAIKTYLNKEKLLNIKIGNILRNVFREAVNKLKDDYSNPEELYGYIHDISSNLEFTNLIDQAPGILGSNKILIVLDTLESYKVHSFEMLEGLKGVIQAVISLFGIRKYNNYGIRLFIPAEVFEDVATEIPAKIMPRTIFLRWRFSDLLKMISKRYFRMISKNNLISGYDKKEIDNMLKSGINKEGYCLRNNFWYDKKYIPQTIHNEYQREEDSFAYILRHTQRKPREVILILNKIIEIALENNELPNISEKSIKKGVHDNGVLQVLVSDALSPFEGYIENIVDRARSIFAENPRFMSGIELKKFSKKIWDLGYLEEIHPDNFLKILLRSGLIGVLKNYEKHKEKPPKNYWVAKFEYLMQNHIPFSNDRIYCVHPMFGDFFDMSRGGLNCLPIYPEPEDDIWLEKVIGIKSE